MAQQLVFILRDTQTGREHPVSPEGLRIGRASQNDVVLSDKKVSRNHATLWAQDAQLYVRDEGSTNGTWVNDERITAPRALQAGDRVRVGDTVFEVAVSAAPPLPVEALPARAALPALRQAGVPAVPIAIAGGVVLVILIALVIRAGRGAIALPTPTVTVTLTPTVTVTIGPTDTPTPTPTETPTDTPTPVPTPQAVPPELTSPSQGSTHENPITFQWSGSLSAGQTYQVMAYHRESGYTVQSESLTTQEWSTNLPEERFGEWRWTVSVVMGGQAVATSAEWMFWFQPYPGAEETPQPTDTPGPTPEHPTDTPVPPTATPTPGF